MASSATSKKVSRFLKRHKNCWIPFLGYSSLVIMGGILSPKRFPNVFAFAHHHDKWLHLGEYFLLFLIAVHTFRLASIFWLRTYSWCKALIYCLVLGSLVEGIQYFVPGRLPDLGDWISNAVGAAMALAFFFFMDIFSFQRFTSPLPREERASPGF